ncbi:MAG: antibiotic biosynthesis monooxygenase [Tatlockia sp.]|nr:antibiotic biosynthesis monooxygenase [Tatlockia sp.]
MSGHVFVVSEWLAREGCGQELWNHFKTLIALTLEKEKGCIRAHVTRQILHPGAPGKSKYTIILLQEYSDLKAFDIHCASDYVHKAFKDLLENQETSLIEDWRCRLFSEEA